MRHGVSCPGPRASSTGCVFQDFLRKEFSEENILFWQACEYFNHVPAHDKKEVRFLAPGKWAVTERDSHTGRSLWRGWTAPVKVLRSKHLLRAGVSGDMAFSCPVCTNAFSQPGTRSCAPPSAEGSAKAGPGGRHPGAVMACGGRSPWAWSLDGSGPCMAWPTAAWVPPPVIVRPLVRV